MEIWRVLFQISQIKTILNWGFYTSENFQDLHNLHLSPKLPCHYEEVESHCSTTVNPDEGPPTFCSLNLPVSGRNRMKGEGG